MWRFFAAIIFVMITQPILTAANPDEQLEKQRELYLSRIEKANEELEAARENRKKKVISATNKYIKELKKVKTYWEKKGNHEKALEYEKKVTDLKKMTDAQSESQVQPSPKKSSRLNMGRIVGKWRDSDGASLMFFKNGSVRSNWDKKRKRSWKYVRNNEYELHVKRSGKTWIKALRLSDDGNLMTVIPTKKGSVRLENSTKLACSDWKIARH